MIVNPIETHCSDIKGTLHHIAEQYPFRNEVVPLGMIQEIESSYYKLSNQVSQMGGLDKLRQNQELFQIYEDTKSKVDAFFRDHTLLLEVDYDAGPQNHLALRCPYGKWNKNYDLMPIKDSPSVWQIHLQKFTSAKSNFEFKIVLQRPSSLEWQPGDNLHLFWNSSNINIKINGAFNDLNSWNIQCANKRDINNSINNPILLPGTVCYVKGNIPEDVQKVAKQIEELERMYDKKELDNLKAFICPISRALLKVPVFSTAHPGLDRHHLDASIIDSYRDNNNTTECSVCRASGIYEDKHIVIDLMLQEKILNELRETITNENLKELDQIYNTPELKNVLNKIVSEKFKQDAN